MMMAIMTNLCCNPVAGFERLLKSGFLQKRLSHTASIYRIFWNPQNLSEHLSKIKENQWRLLCWIFDLLASDCKISPKTGQVRPRREKGSGWFCCCPSSDLPTLQKTFVLSPTCRQKVQSWHNDGELRTGQKTHPQTNTDSHWKRQRNFYLLQKVISKQLCSPPSVELPEKEDGEASWLLLQRLPSQSPAPQYKQ